MQRHVLVADDSAPVRAMVKKNLGEHFRLTLTSSGDAALAAFGDELPDACIFDVTMPGMDGYTLSALVKHQYPAIPVFLISAAEGPMDDARFSLCGADLRLGKPFSKQVVIDRLNELIVPRAQPTI